MDSDIIPPFWQMLKEKIAAASWPIASIRKTSGISNRQVKYWGEREYIQTMRDSETGWRRFTFVEIWGFLVASAFMAIDTPPLKAGFFVSHTKNKDILNKALDALLEKRPCYLVTNFKEMVATEKNILEEIKHEKGPFVIIDLIPLARVVLSIVEDDSPRARDLSTFKYLTFTVEEKRLVEIIRSKKYSEISIKQLEDKIKIVGTRYISKDFANEFQKQKSTGKKTTTTTHQDENGKITNAKIKEDISQAPWPF